MPCGIRNRFTPLSGCPMDLDRSEKISTLLQVLFLLVLPWVALVLGLFLSLTSVWFLLLCITWFGCGVVFYATVH